MEAFSSIGETYIGGHKGSAVMRGESLVGIEKTHLEGGSMRVSDQEKLAGTLFGGKSVNGGQCGSIPHENQLRGEIKRGGGESLALKFPPKMQG